MMRKCSGLPLSLSWVLSGKDLVSGCPRQSVSVGQLNDLTALTVSFIAGAYLIHVNDIKALIAI